MSAHGVIGRWHARHVSRWTRGGCAQWCIHRAYSPIRNIRRTSATTSPRGNGGIAGDREDAAKAAHAVPNVAKEPVWIVTAKYFRFRTAADCVNFGMFLC